MKSIFSLTLCLLALVACNEAKSEPDFAKMLIIGVKGTELKANNPIIKELENNNVSGIIFFEKNIAQPTDSTDSKAQFKDFIADLQTLKPYTLFMSIDQEGGLVNRMKTKYGFAPMISQKEVGEFGRKAHLEARKVATTIASEVASMGLNMNFSPSVDVDINPLCPVIGKVKRSFSADPNIVASCGWEYIDAHRKKDVITALKHFPGHGSSEVDSHKGFTDITKTWKEEELIPYRKLIANRRCDMVMVSHLFNEKFDTKYPATLSKSTIDSLLRKELGWDGVVITDDMQMKAITDNYGFEESIILAVNAGVDLFIISNNIAETSESIADRFVKTLKTALKDGKIDETQIKRSLERIERVRYCIDN